MPPDPITDPPTPEQAEETGRPAGELPRDRGLCPVCHWSMAPAADEGCVPGNCSQRPLPGTSARGATNSYDAAREAMTDVGRLRFFAGQNNATISELLRGAADEIERLTRERDRLIAAWPHDTSGVVLHDPTSGKFHRNDGSHLFFVSLEDAVRHAAGLGPEGGGA